MSMRVKAPGSHVVGEKVGVTFVTWEHVTWEPLRARVDGLAGLCAVKGLRLECGLQSGLVV